MKITIKVDVREKDLIDIISTNISVNVELIKEQLPIGDIIICNEDNKELLVIERKSISDLSASIKDGRYEEQSFRLINSLKDTVHPHNILYLIEGSINFKKESKEITSLYSSLFSLNYYKGFSVIRTFSINETAHFILSIAKKLSKESDRTPFYSVNIIGGTSGTVDEIDNVDVDVDEVKYSKVIKRVKKDNITKENIGEIILSQIPGVSLATAQAVLNNYGGKISELIKSLEKDQNALNNIKQVNSKGKEVKIRKTSITNIYKFML